MKRVVKSIGSGLAESTPVRLGDNGVISALYWDRIAGVNEPSRVGSKAAYTVHGSADFEVTADDVLLTTERYVGVAVSSVSIDTSVFVEKCLDVSTFEWSSSRQPKHFRTAEYVSHRNFPKQLRKPIQHSEFYKVSLTPSDLLTQVLVFDGIPDTQAVKSYKEAIADAGLIENAISIESLRDEDGGYFRLTIRVDEKIRKDVEKRIEILGHIASYLERNSPQFIGAFSISFSSK